ncbi:ZYRO0D02178p [Zygosaccharomyces rouxii]|uniref:ZYRO0D02178p n=1 Tax=Zygosaccharomyces rouxii (strain ATCC 2623 / CBS 732 / NBRC 1130 / NCYC 568 / NRRL Y-229) TaxID=559307 RepID=C5DUX4_ZYGRC|nr:uncharacterized protein ZYRO0D02178g [Zygosaccharomyces rouxii]KAH9200509.1 DNA-directed RNA polymerase I, subunit RPA34.5 [Zygosaccharomyces rouxii]CAR27593.1 ZYRO0D02178p [Zygosaccharomyces rouxii]
MGDSRSESVDAQTSESSVFSPPSDYKRVKHLKKFHKKNGEQLWLIKLPRSLDVSKLKTLPLDLEGGEQPIPVEEGNDKDDQYSIGEDKTQKGGQDSSNLSLLVPEESRESLKISGHGNSLKFDKVLSVRKTAQIPKIDYEKLTVPRSNVVKVEGLRTRHYASGYGPEDEDKVEDTSKEEHSERKSKKHKKHSSDEDHSKKKSKKDKKK